MLRTVGGDLTPSFQAKVTKVGKSRGHWWGTDTSMPPWWTKRAGSVTLSQRARLLAHTGYLDVLWLPFCVLGTEGELNADGTKGKTAQRAFPHAGTPAHLNSEHLCASASSSVNWR